MTLICYGNHVQACNPLHSAAMGTFEYIHKQQKDDRQ